MAHKRDDETTIVKLSYICRVVRCKNGVTTMPPTRHGEMIYHSFMYGCFQLHNWWNDDYANLISSEMKCDDDISM
jgi:hypothetical protein